MTTANADVEALKSFIDDNEDLERLETLVDRFNMFEALDLVRQEIRHSAFLRWLLDPTEPHGLGDYCLRQLLRRVIKAGEGIAEDAPSLFDLDGWNLGRAEVRREWHHIDLLIVSENHRFVCAIENKIDSGEGRDQLEGYSEVVKREYPGYKKAFVFLTISGYPPDPPSDAIWVPMGYGDLASLIENVLERRKPQLNDEISLFIQQYLDMVRRHILESSEIQALCQQLYQNHRRALDLIFEHRIDRAAEVSQSIQDYISSQGDKLIPVYNGKTCIKFVPKCMDVLPYHGTAYESQRMLTWNLDNKGEKVQFRLELGPGDQGIRQKVYDKASEVPAAFGNPKKLSLQWHSFTGLRDTWIATNEYNELSDEEIKNRIGEKIKSLLEQKGQQISDALQGIS